MKINYNFYHLRFIEAGISIEHAAHLCGVTTKTIRNWENGKIAVPTSAAKVIKAYGAGYLPTSCKDWDGWRLLDDKLWLPEGISYTPSEIRAMYFIRQMKHPERQQLKLQLY